MFFFFYGVAQTLSHFVGGLSKNKNIKTSWTLARVCWAIGRGITLVKLLFLLYPKLQRSYNKKLNVSIKIKTYIINKYIYNIYYIHQMDWNNLCFTPPSESFAGCEPISCSAPVGPVGLPHGHRRSSSSWGCSHSTKRSRGAKQGLHQFSPYPESVPAPGGRP